MSEIVKFKEYKESGIKVLEGQKKRPKLKLDGTEKRIINNQSDNRWVDPIRDKNDIKRIKEYFNQQIENARVDRKKIQARNKLYFIISINTGFRTPEMLELKWRDFYHQNGSFRKRVNKKESKTSKIKPLFITETIINAIKEYRQLVKPKFVLDNYIFFSNKELYEIYDIGTEKNIINGVVDSNGKSQHNGISSSDLENEILKLKKLKLTYKVRRFHISVKPVENFIKSATKHLNIKGNYAARSMRKTAAYQYYTMLVNQNDQQALIKVQHFLNHRDSFQTATYLGITYSDNFRELSELNL